jgi:hypothetical protein
MRRASFVSHVSARLQEDDALALESINVRTLPLSEYLFVVLLVALIAWFAAFMSQALLSNV